MYTPSPTSLLTNSLSDHVWEEGSNSFTEFENVITLKGMKFNQIATQFAKKKLTTVAHFSEFYLRSGKWFPPDLTMTEKETSLLKMSPISLTE